MKNYINKKRRLHINEENEFKIGDIVTGSKNYKWLVHYYARISYIIGDDYFLKKIKDLGTDEYNQFKEYIPWKAEDLKLIKDYKNYKENK